MKAPRTFSSRLRMCCSTRQLQQVGVLALFASVVGHSLISGIKEELIADIRNPAASNELDQVHATSIVKTRNGAPKLSMDSLNSTLIEPQEKRICAEKSVTYFVYPVQEHLYSPKQSTEKFYNSIGKEQYKLEFLLPKYFNASCRPQEAWLADFFVVPFLPTRLYLTENRKNITYVQEHFADLLSHIGGNFPYWNRSTGADHIFIFPSGRGSGLVGKLARQVENSVIITPEANPRGGSLNLARGLIVPGYQRHRGTKNGDMYFSFFMGALVSGNLDEADYSHGIRPLLLNRTNELFTRSKVSSSIKLRTVFRGKNENVSTYFSKLKRSTFCICPRGSSSWTMRVFHAINFGCVPVIVSDDVILPFQRELNWSQIAIFVPEEYARYVYYFMFSCSKSWLHQAKEQLLQASTLLNYNLGSRGGAMALIHEYLRNYHCNKAMYKSKPKNAIEYAHLQREKNEVGYLNAIPAIVVARKVNCILPLVLTGLSSIMGVSFIDVLVPLPMMKRCSELLSSLQSQVCGKCVPETRYDEELDGVVEQWLRQQLIKLLHASQSGHNFVLIWDGDTVPLNYFPLFAAENKPFLFCGGPSSPVYLPRGRLPMGYQKSVRALLDPKVFDISRSCVVQFQVWRLNTLTSMLKRIGKGSETRWAAEIRKYLYNSSTRLAFSEFSLYAAYALDSDPASVVEADASTMPWLRDPLHLSDVSENGCCPLNRTLRGIAASGLKYLSFERDHFEFCLINSSTLRS